MVARNEIYWADLGPAGRRPVVVLTRTPAIPHLHSVTCAAITRTVRGIRTEVSVGPVEGLPQEGVVTCDALVVVAKERLDPIPLGRLREVKRAELDQALRYALDIRY